MRSPDRDVLVFPRAVRDGRFDQTASCCIPGRRLAEDLIGSIGIFVLPPGVGNVHGVHYISLPRFFSVVLSLQLMIVAIGQIPRRDVMRSPTPATYSFKVSESPCLESQINSSLVD